MTSSARDRIADIVLDIARVAVANYRNLGYEYMSREDAEDFEHEMNNIIAIVREAVLSDDMTLAYNLGKQSWRLDWMDGKRSGDDDGGES